MKKEHAVLREFVSLVLEKAVDSETAGVHGLALFVNTLNNNSTYKSYILYDPSALAEHVKSSNLTSDLLERDVIESYFYGGIDVDKPRSTYFSRPARAWNAFEVEAVAAKRGYGPLMYDIAMKLNNGLMADRTSVSAAAKKVWKNYKNRGDVEAKKLDNIKAPVTPTEEDDSLIHGDDPNDPLNYAYFAKGSGPDVSELLFSHESAILNMANLGLKQQAFEIVLIKAWSRYFGLRLSTG